MLRPFVHNGTQLPVHGFEEAVEEVVAVGPGVDALEDGVGYGFGAAVSDAQGLVVDQFGRGFGGVEQFAAFGFGVELEAVESLHAAARSLVDVELGAADEFVEVVVAVATPAALAKLIAPNSVVAQPPVLHGVTACVAWKRPSR